MNNLFNLARNGISVAQAAIRVTGDNLTNGMSTNYSRRNLIIGELGGMSTAQGFYGYGARASGVERAYDAFANNQLRDSLSGYASLTGRMEQLADIDNMLADESDNVSVSLGKLFKDMATLSGDPADGPARAAVFTSLDVLANRYNASAKRLSGLEKSTNTQIERSAKEINSFTEQLAEINKQLERVQGNGTPPADLLDQRDMLLEGLSEHLGITVTEDHVSGRVSVTLADGRPLVSGGTAYKLQTSPSDADPNKTIVSYVDANGKASPLDENAITKGRLGGLFKFRNEDLTVARQDLDQIAFMMAHRMNEQNRAGFTPEGEAGGDLFSLPDIKAIANAKNRGTDALDNIRVTDFKEVKSENYDISFDGTDWVVKGADGRIIPLDPAAPLGVLKFEGIEITLPTPSTAEAGDKFTLNPMAGAAEGISRKITNGQEFAASDNATDGPGNNKNLQEMLKIQDEALIGNDTLSAAYASLAGKIGESAREVKSYASSAESDLRTKFDTKQALSGVNMDEEYINLDMFRQYYNGNAQLLKTATAMFDALLAIR
ncbi:MULTISPECIES: flagellar hook-associated protein FlgK [Enterobacter]|jgi:flagellar hook-associated protein 1 FlgK|uniref:flagellar hook-associated protein FlgK n=1 Tax=Enterobacter TaxID=547 RepID=UPI0015F5E4D5|nr:MULTISPECIES: flagellar hook-associated protein FlgK [Enterobacter]MBA7773743.1 flagellar hook-associated protein FlgK [Enterobacter sp. RHBSTW-00974]MBA7778906.1 flagellar hook-associated protein FlgK [Enterobacter sp. RHBSTW-00318]MBA7831509.1 flagellar hook-associated protein FlgK [Enterobacter sp. RHBSTW-00340]MBA8038990.1 flagellar hook-associated protein FlgK [Enterobacter sp. RHBSTW-00131]MBG0585266.1 flagellar hook-associated protein FlgK [Enterobacter ludwigii]